MAAHSSILAWGIPTDRGARRATVQRDTKSGNNWATMHSTAQGHRVPEPPAPAPPQETLKLVINQNTLCRI